LVGAANFANKNAGTTKTVAATGLGLNGTDIGNYVLQNISATTAADITPKELTASVTAIDKVYDGTTAANASVSITGGLVGNETLVLNATTSFNSKNVKEAQRVTVDRIQLSDGSQGGLASNYNLTAGQTTTAYITPKTLTATAIAQDKNYDGKNQATSTVTISSGLIGRETLTITSESSFSDFNPGQYKLVIVDRINLNDATDGSGGIGSNYLLAPGQKATATIRPKMLVANQEPKLKAPNEIPHMTQSSEMLELTNNSITQETQAIETSKGVVINHFKTPTEKSIGIVAIRLPRQMEYTNKDLIIALADEIDLNNTHDGDSVALKTVNNQALPSWIHFDPIQKILAISAAPKEAFPLQLILSLGDRRYLMQISESMYID
jgi:hypothetical protein